MTSAGGPPTAGEWGALLSAPTIPERELARAQVPDEPGVYLWRPEGQPVYVGKATSLRGRAWRKRFAAGVSLEDDVLATLPGVQRLTSTLAMKNIVTAGYPTGFS